jgi:hypothetical protein
MEISQKTKNRPTLSYHSTIPLLGIYPKEYESYIPMFAALFTIVKLWINQGTQQPINE